MKKLLIIMLLAFPLMAQGPGGHMGQGGEKKKLSLDEATQKKMKDIKAEQFKVMQKLKIAMEKKEIELKEILLEGHDLAKIKVNCEERGKLWAQIKYTEFEYDAKVKEILTEEQFHQYIRHKMAKKRQHQGHPGSHQGKHKRH